MKLSPYDGVGADEADAHVDQFVTACWLEGYDQPTDLVRWFPVFLTGRAREWFYSMQRREPSLIQTWDGLSRAFIATFSPTLSSGLAFKGLMDFFQGEGEPMEKYIS